MTAVAYRALEDLQIYRDAERYSDRVHELVYPWRSFDKNSVGAQLVRAADSIGANIAESHGRYHFAERIHFLYYARGSAYETVYWLRRAGNRKLLPDETAEKAVIAYTDLIASLNRVIKTMKELRNTSKPKGKAAVLAETTELYIVADKESADLPF